ncbi:MAG: glutamine--fructose-6-phosphate transaminase (isomerizing) [Candidatus Diapherotrites archaeon]|nr:glutamine--fructose-6-phosphate transaminase (isomerizing) [Candidatus Diapherotrites archaeon]
MCGIVACVGDSNAPGVVLEGLKRLEYRGYDSWGIASLHGNSISISKKVGRISEAAAALPAASVSIGHTRWATHGGVTECNAHPHTDCSGGIAIVHNGIIENYSALKKSLELKGHIFKSETDTEVIAHLIEEEKKKGVSFARAVGDSLRCLEGSFAIAALDCASGAVIGARKNSPLVAAFDGNGKCFLASDVTAFLQHTKKAVFLDDGEMVSLGNGRPVFTDFSLREIKKTPVEISWSSEQAEKMGHKHFMLKEIFEQPEKIAATMQNRLSGGSITLKEIAPVLRKAKQFDRVVLLGCGTAYYAGMVGEYVFEELCGLPVQAEYASEFRYRKPAVGKKTLAIAISQSGETADTLAAVREAKARGATVVSIVNVVGSAIARESDFVFYINAGPEIGVASTKAFTCQLTALAMLAVSFAAESGKIGEAAVKELVGGLRMLPQQLEAVLQESGRIKEIAKRYSDRRNALFLGRGVNYPIAMEGALKLKEISYIHAEAMPAAEMKHGPIALIDKQMPVVFIAVKDRSYEKILGNIEEVKARGGKVIAIANSGDSHLQQKADEIIFVPKAHELLQPIINAVPMQLLAYYIADIRGCDVDKPRNLAKSVTVE